MLPEIVERRIPGNRSVKVLIFPIATTHEINDFLKPLLKKNPDNIILHTGTNNSVNETSLKILNGILSLKYCIEKLCPTRKVIVPNIIYRSDNGKASLTVKMC